MGKRTDEFGPFRFWRDETAGDLGCKDDGELEKNLRGMSRATPPEHLDIFIGAAASTGGTDFIRCRPASPAIQLKAMLSW